MSTLAGLLAAAALAGGWQAGAPLPLARSEVAGAAVGGEVVVVGGFLAGGSSSPRIDAYSPSTGRWRRLPDLPVAVNHAAAAGYRGRLYVAGGYAGPGRPLRSAFVLERGRWRALPPLPAMRAAAGAVVVVGRLYVVGGVGPAGLARATFVLDLAGVRWRALPGPRPRQHLAVAALGGIVYAIAGRTTGFDTNLALAESYRPGADGWRSLPPVPEARGGTGLAAVGGELVSVGGEAPGGTIASVYAFRPTAGRWRRLPDLPTPRHGLAVVGLGDSVYAVGGGRTPGFSVSDANEALALTTR